MSRFAPLGQRNFRLLWTGSLLSVTAFMTSFTLVPSIAFELTGSNQAAGIAAMGSGLAQVLLGPFGGVIADRYPKKPLVLFGQAIPGVVLTALGILIVTDLISIPLLLAGTLMMGVGFAVMGPARQAWVGQLVPKRMLPNAVALQQLSMNLAQVVGPGLIFIAPLLGLEEKYLYLVVAPVFLIVLPLTTRLPWSAPETAPADRRPMRTELAEGFRYIRTNPRLRVLWVYFLIIVACGFAFQTLLPGTLEVFGQDPFNVGPTYLIFGLLGIIVNLQLVGIVGGRFAWQALIAMGLLMAAGFWLAANAQSYGIFLILSGLVGAGRSGVMLVNQSILMANTNPRYFGRVMSFVMMGFGLQSLLGPAWGGLADAIGNLDALFAVGVIAASATVLMTLAWLRIRNLPPEAGTAAAEAPAPAVMRPAATAAAAGPPPPDPAFVQRAAPVVLMEGQKRTR